jgi:hypothetical protein
MKPGSGQKLPESLNSNQSGRILQMSTHSKYLTNAPNGIQKTPFRASRVPSGDSCPWSGGHADWFGQWPEQKDDEADGECVTPTGPALCAAPRVSQLDPAVLPVSGLVQVLHGVRVNVQQAELAELAFSYAIVVAHGAHERLVATSIDQFRPQVRFVECLLVRIVQVPEKKRLARTAGDDRQA